MCLYFGDIEKSLFSLALGLSTQYLTKNYPNKIHQKMLRLYYMPFHIKRKLNKELVTNKFS